MLLRWLLLVSCWLLDVAAGLFIVAAVVAVGGGGTYCRYC